MLLGQNGRRTRRLLLSWGGRLETTGTRLLNGVGEATEVIPARHDVHQLAQRCLDLVSNLLARPFPVVVWRGLEAQIQRLALDLVKERGVVGVTWTTVRQTVRTLGVTLGVVQHDGVGEPAGSALNDAGHLTACSGFRFAEEEEGVPAGALVIVWCRFVPAPDLFDAQMWSDRYGFNSYSLAQLHMTTDQNWLIFRTGAGWYCQTRCKGRTGLNGRLIGPCRSGSGSQSTFSEGDPVFTQTEKFIAAQTARLTLLPAIT